jgi:hypothetical protein
MFQRGRTSSLGLFSLINCNNSVVFIFCKNFFLRGSFLSWKKSFDTFQNGQICFFKNILRLLYVT